VVPITGDTGSFWFFSDDNLELMIKVLDGRALNGHWWVYYASLSQVAYELLVEDTATGQILRYENEAGTFASRGDIRAFSEAVTTNPTITSTLATIGEIATTVAPRSDVDCGVPDTLCFHDGRFAVTVSWQAFDGTSGVGVPVPLAGDSGAFSFFDSSNLELLVKILDGQSINGRWWVFYGSLSNVGYTLTVRDLETGVVRTYENEVGTFASRGDTAAF
ncbi:MAG: hypothetical protein AAGD38_23375, partial [Acidobacteriota bacterium]